MRGFSRAVSIIFSAGSFYALPRGRCLLIRAPARESLPVSPAYSLSLSISVSAMLLMSFVSLFQAAQTITAHIASDIR